MCILTQFSLTHSFCGLCLRVRLWLMPLGELHRDRDSLVWQCAGPRTAMDLARNRTSVTPWVSRNPFISLFRQQSESMVLYSLENTSKDHISFNFQQYPFY